MEARTLDTSDVDKHVGSEVGAAQLKEPITLTDIRRWAMALDYYNPIHFDEAAAARTSLGTIVASQSFTANCCAGHGTIPAIIGTIEGSHVVFGGDEWWFYGPHIAPGDLIRTKARFDGYRIADTKFAGPTMFSRGDTSYFNQRGEAVAKQRCTMGRYIAATARERGFFDVFAEAPSFTPEQLAGFKRMKADWVKSGESGAGPASVAVGDRLPTRVIGPHTIASFTKEYAALIFTAWGSSFYEGEYLGMDAGWLPEMISDSDDPGMAAGQEEGPASAHTDLAKAKLVGLPRHYGYGSSMGAWTLDYVAYWAGDEGFIRHAKIDYRSPIFEGDVALLNGEVQELRFEPMLGTELAVIAIRMTNQDEVTLASGYVQVQLKRF